MPKYKFPLTNGKTLTLEGDGQPSDEDVEQHAQDAGVTPIPASGFSTEEFAKLSAEEKRNVLKHANETPLSEPTTFAGGFVKGMRESTNPVVGPWMRQGPDKIASGVDKLKQGRYLGGAADIIKGAGTTVAPVALPFALAGAPLATITGAMGGMAGSMGAEATAKAVGAGEDVQNAAGVAGGLLGGGAAAAATPSEMSVGQALSARGTRMAKMPALERMAAQHGPATVAGIVGGPKAAAVAEAIQSPTLNKFAGDALQSYARNVQGVQAPPVALPVIAAATKGRVAAAPKPPPTLSEQLGVSPTSTGAVMDSLPNTAVERGRMPVDLEHGAARAADAAEASRGQASELGVSGGSSLDQLPDVSQVDRRISGAPFERPPAKVSPPAPKRTRFQDLADELGLNPDKLESETGQASSPTPATATDTPSTSMAKAAVQTEGRMKGAPETRMPTDTRMDEMVAANGGMEPPPGLDPAGRAAWYREQIAKELLSRDSFRNMGVGSRKRGANFEPQE